MTGMASRVVVIGNGMAGSRVVEEIRARDPQRLLSVTVFGEEPHGAYNRILLSEVLAGRHRAEDIGLGSPGWHAAQDVDLHLGARVTEIDRGARKVWSEDGTVTPYDVLVLATGSQAWIPPIPGLREDDGTLVDGAHVFRTLDDCSGILRATDGARRAVVLGGGLLGLEAARGLAGRGIEVVVLHNASHLMERQLDGPAGRVLARTLGDLGVRVRVDARTTGVIRRPDGQIGGVVLDDGTSVLADVLVVACGVRPEVSLARDCGLPVDSGVVVDDTLRSVGDPRVFALGECAQHAGQVYGLVAPAWEQAAVVAAQVTGADPGVRYTGSRTVTRLKAAGVEVAAMGETHADDDSVEIVHFADPARGTYKKVVVRDGRLVGAILVGDPTTVGSVTQLYDRGSPVPGDRLSLLFGRRDSPATPTDSPAHLPDRAVVCRCNGVTKGAITACFLDGAHTVEDIAGRTRATTGCGGCRDTVAGLCDWLGASGAATEPAVPTARTA